MSSLDLSRQPYMDLPQFTWFKSQGIPASFLVEMAMTVRVVHGVCTPDGWLDLDPDGRSFITFEQDNDCVFWCPATGELTTWHHRAFALGEDNIVNAGTYALDGYLTIYRDPLEWLRDEGRGIVILDWSRAFDMLRDAPRILCAEQILPLYKKHMTPRHLPELAVLTTPRRIAA